MTREEKEQERYILYMKVKELILQGKTNEEIMDVLDINHNQLGYIIKSNNLQGFRTRGRKKRKQEEVKQKKEQLVGNNIDRKKCRTCIYRRPRNDMFKANCRFILVEGHSRGCPAHDCNKYIKGRPAKIKQNLY